MDKNLFNLIKETTEIQSTSAFEHNIRGFIKKKISPLVDKVELDGLGGVFGVRKNLDAPKVMFAAHMDEIGFMVTAITEKGYLKVTPLGGWNPQVVSAQRFTLQTKLGDYPIVSSSVPPHLLRGKEGNNKIDIEKILFDGGFSSREEAWELGVRPGDAIVPDVETTLMANGKTILGKAWDNRYGVVALIEALKELQGEQLPNHLIAGANVQEEVGLRGTKGSVRKFDPDIFFAVDCSPANDTYGDSDAFGKIGEGVLIRLQDSSVITPKEIREFMLDTAETHDIPYQYYISKGGTDAGAAHQLNEGIPSSVVGVSARYIHTHQTVFHIDDFYAAKEMIVQIAKSLDESTLETLKIK